MIHDHNRIWLLRPGVEAFGTLPDLPDETSARPAVEQFGERWLSIDAMWKLDNSGLQNGSENHELLGAIHLAADLVMLFEPDLVAIVQADRAMVVSRIAFDVTWVASPIASPDDVLVVNAVSRSEAGISYVPEIFFARGWHSCGHCFGRWDDAKAFVDHLMASWKPPGFIKRTIIRRTNETPNTYWDRNTRRSERFADLDRADIDGRDGRAA